jgi:hypothetical protein
VSRETSSIEGFGFKPAESEHYFLVSISSPTGDVQISEHMSWDNEMWKGKIHAVKDENDERLRVVLPRIKWDYISDATSSEFNRRLKAMGYRKGNWKSRGLTPVSRLFGKELVLLAWGIEDADPGRIPLAISNWLGLLPEERWWLYTMTNAATGQTLKGRNTGWRAAIRFALCDNPITAGKEEQRVGLIASLDGKGQNADSGKKRQGNLLDFQGF